MGMSLSLCYLFDEFRGLTVDSTLVSMRQNAELYGVLEHEIEAMLLDGKLKKDTILDANACSLDYYTDILSELNHCSTVGDMLALLGASNFSEGEFYQLESYVTSGIYYVTDSVSDMVEKVINFLEYSRGNNIQDYESLYCKLYGLFKLEIPDSLILSTTCEPYARIDLDCLPSGFNEFRKSKVRKYVELLNTPRNRVIMVGDNLRGSTEIDGIVDGLYAEVDYRLMYRNCLLPILSNNCMQLTATSIVLFPLSKLTLTNRFTETDKSDKYCVYSNFNSAISKVINKEFYSSDYFKAVQMAMYGSVEFLTALNDYVESSICETGIGCVNYNSLVEGKDIVSIIFREVMLDLLVSKELETDPLFRGLDGVLSYYSTPEPYEPWSDQYIIDRWGIDVLTVVRGNYSCPYCIRELLMAYGSYIKYGSVRSGDIPDYVLAHIKIQLGTHGRTNYFGG